MLYPVSPDVQIRDQQHDPLRPGEIKPAVFNAIAYVRYSLGLLGETELETNDAYRLAIALADKAVESAINPNTVAQLVMTEASEVDVERPSAPTRARRYSGRKSIHRKVARGQQRLDQCRSAGYEIIDCCKALAWATIRYVVRLKPLTRRLLFGALTTLPSLTHISRRPTPPWRPRAQPFNHAETKAWLTCQAHVDAPNSITELKDKYGDFHQDGPISPAEPSQAIWTPYLSWQERSGPMDCNCRVDR